MAVSSQVLPITPTAPAAAHWRDRIVAASDGRTSSDAALIAARVLAGQSHFGVVSVIADGYSTDRVSGSASALPTPAGRLDAIRGQLTRSLGDEDGVWLESRTGYPPAVLASFAELHDVSLMVAGIGRQRVLDRLLGDESTLRLARLMRTPLLAVSPHAAMPPRRIVLAVDFSAPCLRAGRLALAIAAPDATLFAVHVTSTDSRPAHVGALGRFIEVLQRDFGGRVRAVELSGDPATEILAFANKEATDAIAVGTRGEARRTYGTLGPVATRVIRCSSQSLIVAP